MANIKEQKLRKLKRTYAGGSLIGFIVVGFVVFAAFASLLVVFAIYITDSKLRDENERVKNMAKLYRLSATEDGENLAGYVAGEGNDFIVTDKSKNVIEVHGTNTCDLESGKRVDLLGLAEAVEDEDPANYPEEVSPEMVKEAVEGAPVIYPDTAERVIIPGPNGHVRVDLYMLQEKLLREQGNVRLPFWIDVPLDDGNHMICKAHFAVYFREIIILGILSGIIAVLTILMLIFILVYICKTIRNRRRMNEVFFMDETTGGHNWLWFIVNTESVLKKRSNASNEYAVLDIVFVNYRNFCVCHSVEEGESMLRIVDDVIRKHLNKKELSAHHSAAHFAAMLEYTGTDALKERLEQLLRDLEKISDDHKFSFWIGVDVIGESHDGSGRVIRRKNADIEIAYNNAGAARATITGDDSAIAFFDDNMVKEQRWIDMISENQEKALAGEEFVVYYQPKYDPRTNELKGAEALIRWNSPQNGMISPGRFIPIFEKNGFITKIDHYMLKHVAQDQRRWLDMGYRCVPVSVNVSRAHFIESDLAEQIRDIVDGAGTPHELIEIELTESAFFDDKHALISTIAKLKEYGFTVSMDDFGSGYSSLNSLKEMPLDVLKLDADFFRNDEGDERGRIVVAEAIRLAKNLKMRTVAEGIEIKEQVDFLAEEGCDMIQGFYFAKPMPGEEYMQKMPGSHI